MLDFSIVLLVSYIVASPIIYELGKAVDKPLALVVDEEFDLSLIMDSFPIPPITINVTDGLPCNKKYIKEANSRPVMVYVTRRVLENNQGKNLIEFLLDMMQNTIPHSDTCHGIPLLICRNGIPESIEDEVFALYFSGNVSYLQFSEDMIPAAEELPIIFNLISEWEKKEMITGLLPAAFFLYPWCCKKGDVDFETVYKASREINEVEEQRRDTDDLLDLFRHVFEEWLSNSSYARFYRLPYLNSQIEKEINTALFFSEEKGRLFISEELFGEIVMPLTTIFSVNTIKERLSEAKLIIKGDRKKYTARMTFFNSYGILKRIRMLRFDSEMLEAPLEIGFLDDRLIEREEEDHVNNDKSG